MSEGKSNSGSSISTILLIALGVLFLVVACTLIFQLVRPSDGLPTAVPTAGPGTAQPEAGDAWERIQANGKMVVGTTVNYPPFEYYNDNFQMDGFDIALIQEVGKRLGVQVEIKDMAFAGLEEALQINQVDVVAAALTVTDQRKGVVDFSNTYFMSEDALLANSGSAINSIDNIDQLADKKVGVERGTVYDNWLQKNMVETGKMPPQNLLVYESMDHALRDLREGRSDLVALDKIPADAAVQAGGVKLVGEGLNMQQIALGIGKGQTNLQAQLNSALTDMQNDGTLNQLVKQYMAFDDDNIVPLPTPDNTATPVPTATPQPCVDGMGFVQDLNLDDNNMTTPPKMVPSWAFTKGWRIRNTGTCPWEVSYTMVYVDGNHPAAQMGGQPTPVTAVVQPGQTNDMFIDLVAPIRPGTYQGFWQMTNAQGVPFGDRVWVGIEVIGAATVTPAPTQTPSPNISFTVDRSSINQGDCVVFNWNVTGANEVYFYESGEPWQQNQVAPQGGSQECPQSTITYELRVQWPDGRTEIKQITIYVQPVDTAPVIDQFTLTPAYQINVGDCVLIQWKVSGKVDTVNIYRNDNILWGTAPISHQLNDCPPGTGNVSYRIEAIGPGGTNQAQQNLTIVQPTSTPPTATSIPPDPAPEIHSFLVTPSQIPAGDCVQISWNTGGGTSKVQLKRNGKVIYDNAPLQGSTQDCLSDAGDYTYRLKAKNNADQSTVSDQPVKVNPKEPDDPTLFQKWWMTAYWDSVSLVPILPGTTVWIQFRQEDNKFTGSTGCNNYNGSFKTSGNSLQIDNNISSTGNTCSDPPGVMEQESAYFNSLTSVAAYSIQGSQLQMTDQSGKTILKFGLAQPR
ncbi:MAG: transporter substrate-binding domain-containing protein [Chloroflexi bacterium]|nr:transporter substrate-binding domain-containing protein [Chloroflexota bacterium]